jgi:hypothetical protein
MRSSSHLLRVSVLVLLRIVDGVEEVVMGRARVVVPKETGLGDRRLLFLVHGRRSQYQR